MKAYWIYKNELGFNPIEKIFFELKIRKLDKAGIIIAELNDKDLLLLRTSNKEIIENLSLIEQKQKEKIFSKIVEEIA